MKWRKKIKVITMEKSRTFQAVNVLAIIVLILVSTCIIFWTGWNVCMISLRVQAVPGLQKFDNVVRQEFQQVARDMDSIAVRLEKLEMLEGEEKKEEK